MAGNVSEWTADWWNFYGPASHFPLVDPLSPYGRGVGSHRVQRGGCYVNHEEITLETSYRSSRPARERSPTTGFRCAAAPH